MLKMVLPNLVFTVTVRYYGKQTCTENWGTLRAEIGGAPLLGVDGLCVVGHGRSSAKAVRNAVALAHRFANQGLVARVADEIAGVAGESRVS